MFDQEQKTVTNQKKIGDLIINIKNRKFFWWEGESVFLKIGTSQKNAL